VNIADTLGQRAPPATSHLPKDVTPLRRTGASDRFHRRQSGRTASTSWTSELPCGAGRRCCTGRSRICANPSRSIS